MSESSSDSTMSGASTDGGHAGTPNTGNLLEVNNLSVFFDTSRGTVRSVDDISFTLARGRTLGIVGESGSGKSVTSKAIMGLLPRQGRRIEGSIRYEGREIAGLSGAEYRPLWGTEMGMVFQDPMTSLNPLHTASDIPKTHPVWLLGASGWVHSASDSCRYSCD